ncbi:MAG: Txe/YoeB family addiction module toxin [Actinomycetes bacterium]
MAGRLIFSDQAWDDYLWWQREDRAMVRRINRLIEAARRDPFDGIGKPEPLRFTLAGAWSRRITDEHRMVYVPRGDDIDIAALRYHYK